MFERYVALGDSQTEGVGDGDDLTGVRGLADRLADRLAVLNPEVQYANPAVRTRPRPLTVAANELRWTATFLGPWLKRRMTGQSSGDGRTAKRPQLLPVLD